MRLLDLHQRTLQVAASSWGVAFYRADAGDPSVEQHEDCGSQSSGYRPTPAIAANKSNQLSSLSPCGSL
jgi:hypothetical protein